MFAPSHPDGGSDWRAERGSPANCRSGGARACGTYASLIEAIRTEHHAEEYAVTYIITRGREELSASPRMNKGEPSGFDWLPTIGHEVTFHTVAIDMDNPHVPGSTTDKIPNTAQSIAAWGEQMRRSEMDGFGWYLTKHGVRLWKPLATAVTDSALYERIIASVRAHVDALDWQSFGQSVKTDKACKEKSRLMSLAYILKGSDQRPYYSEIIDLSRMYASDFDPMPEEIRIAGRRQAPARAQVDPYDFAHEIPPYVAAMISHITPATISDLVAGTSRHDLMRAAAGALLARHFEAELVPVTVRAISLQIGCPIHHAEDDLRGARETVENWQSGKRDITGMATVKAGSVQLAKALDILVSTAQARRDYDARKTEPLPTADEAAAKMYAIGKAAFNYRSADENRLQIIGGTPGTGKSRVALRLMVENATGATPGYATGAAIELAKRSVIAPPTQEVAVELQAAAHKDGHEMIRWTSGLSEKWGPDDDGPEGEYVCKYPSLRLMSDGGLSAQYHGCNGGGGSPCPEVANGCRAALGCIDPDGNPVDPGEPGFAGRWPMQIATHARLPHSLAKLGRHARVIVDEIPQVTVAANVTTADLDDAASELWASVTGRAGSLFVPKYAAALLPMVYAARAQLADTEAQTHAPDLGMARAAAYQVPDEVLAHAPDRDPRLSAQLTPFPKDKAGKPVHVGSPWVKAEYLGAMRSSLDVAKRFRTAGRVAALLWRACQDGARVTSTIVVNDGARSLSINEPGAVMALLVEREAPRLLLTADAVLVEPEVSAHFATKPALHPIYVADGAPVERRVVIHAAARRRAVFTKGKLVPGGRHLELIHVFADWALEEKRRSKLVMVTWKVVAIAARYAQTGDKRLGAEWAEEGQRMADLPRIAEEIAQTFALLAALMKASVAVLHYGATRGVDAYRYHDQLGLLGVPYPNVGAMRAEADHLGTILEMAPDATRDLRESLSRSRSVAEFGQSAGRLRGPRRESPARILCVTDEHVEPAEWDRHDVERRMGNSILSQAEAGMGGAEHGAKGAEHGIKGKEHGAKGAAYGHLGAAHGVKGGRPKAKVIDFSDARRRGLTVAQIADEYGVSESTVKRQAREHRGDLVWVSEPSPAPPIQNGSSDRGGAGGFWHPSDNDERAAIQAEPPANDRGSEGAVNDNAAGGDEGAA